MCKEEMVAMEAAGNRDSKVAMVAMVAQDKVGLEVALEEQVEMEVKAGMPEMVRLVETEAP
jgi:hypothetical protein